MGNCVNCVYHTTSNNDRDYIVTKESDYERRPKVIGKEPHFCTYSGYTKTDYVTGGTVYANCYEKNFHGECMFFDSGETESEE